MRREHWYRVVCGLGIGLLELGATVAAGIAGVPLSRCCNCQWPDLTWFEQWACWISGCF